MVTVRRFMTILTPTPLTSDERARLERVEGVVFDIQRYSIHDGPGLRTNVFLKGCPLRCGWCANPESQSLKPELALSASNCMTCGQFDTPCPECWHNPGGTRPTTDFHERTVICPTGAIHWIGELRTAGEVMQEVLRDVPFYGKGGGMTLTGGEPTLQPDMAEALLRLAKAEKISTAIETCGHTKWAILERLLPYLDDILYDLKHLDSEIHRAHTGVRNELILANLGRLAAIGAPLTIRVPLIPGFNISVEAIRAIAQFVQILPGKIKGVDVLPYHSLGKAKYATLGRAYPWAEVDQLMDEEVNSVARVFELHGFSVCVGGQPLD
jgi:pyruvate formate lyase activating enzyme